MEINYTSLLNLTRLVARNGRLLKAKRADFSSSKCAKQLLSLGEIELNYMKLKVRPYHSPIKISKCKKCHRYDHSSNQCSSKQLCIRCGQHHSFENGCQNEIKCVNCQQNHYCEHSSCPVVQQKRKIIAEQQKMQLAQLLIQQQQSFEYNNMVFPPVSPHSSSQTIIPRTNISLNDDQQKNKWSYALVAESKSKSNHESVEQIILSLSNSINRQLSNISAALTSQISVLATKIDEHTQRTNNIQHQFQGAIIPALKEMAEIIDAFSQQKLVTLTQENQQQDTGLSCSERLQLALMEHQEQNHRTPNSKRQRHRNKLTQIQTNVLS